MNGYEAQGRLIEAAADMGLLDEYETSFSETAYYASRGELPQNVRRLADEVDAVIAACNQLKARLEGVAPFLRELAAQEEAKLRLLDEQGDP